MDGQRGGAKPQYSPDGRWWWDGQRWVPVKGRMPHQRPPFWIGLGAIALLLAGTVVCSAAVANSPSAQPGAKAASVTATRTATPTGSPSATPVSTPTPTAAPTAAPTPARVVAAAPPPTAAPAPPPAPQAGCFPLSNSGTCYEPGEFCRTSDHWRTGRAGNGEAIVCEYNNGWRWEPA